MGSVDAACREVSGSLAAQDREAYFLAAYEILGRTGHPGVTVAALCTRLGVTKGSFYHHFADMAEFVDAFARRWRGWVVALLDAYAAEPDPRRRLELLANSHLVAINGSEPAVRAWAWTNPCLATAVRDLDNHGLAMTLTTWEQVIGDRDTAALSAVVSICFCVGLQQRMGQIEPARYVRLGALFFPRMLGVGAETVWAEYGLALRIHSLDEATPVPRSVAPGPIADLTVLIHLPAPIGGRSRRWSEDVARWRRRTSSTPPALCWPSGAATP